MAKSPQQNDAKKEEPLIELEALSRGKSLYKEIIRDKITKVVIEIIYY